MGKLNKISLVRWSSANSIKTNSNIKYFRGKTIGYILVLIVALSIAIFLSLNKSTMLLNINRSSEAYKILENGEIENHYLMLFQNTDNKPHTFYFRILDNDNIKIRQPKEEFEIKAGGKIRKRVYLYTLENYNTESSDKIVPITIEAYATDDNNIKITKKSIFVYPQK